LGEFTASDGARIAWEEAGSGRPLVLLHGLMAHRGFFRAQAPLGERFRLISVDLRGHGASRGTPAANPSRHPRESGDPASYALTEKLDSRFRGNDDLGLDRVAADIVELAEALDLEGAIRVGWSLGASVLWQVLAGRSGRRFAGAVIVDMTPKVLNEGEWNLGLTPDHVEARSAAFRDDFPTFAAIAGPAIFAPGSDPALGAWAAREFAGNDGAAMGAIWQSLAEADLRPLLPRIAQPTLIVRGVQSPLYGPETADYLARALPNARIAAFAGSGHAPHVEEPERFNALVADFAASLPRIRQPQTTN
jgi:pimeloyl-ACP methyl ester carboxylesterase